MNDVFSRLGEYNEVEYQDGDDGPKMMKKCLAACENQVILKILPFRYFGFNHGEIWQVEHFFVGYADFWIFSSCTILNVNGFLANIAWQSPMHSTGDKSFSANLHLVKLDIR